MKSDQRIPKMFITTVCLTCLFLNKPVVSSASEFTLEEKYALKKFRPFVQNLLYRDYMTKDYYLIRWLRARDLDIAEARSMLTKAIRWRKENKIDTILNETLSFPVTPYYADGFSYGLNPVCTVNARAYDLKKWIMAGKRAELLRSMDQATETGEAGIQYLAERLPFVRQLIVIFDFAGYNQRQQGCLACISVFRQWISHYENYYPQLYKYTIYVNTPRIFKRMFNAFKPLLSKHTRQGLKVFGENKEEWRSELFKIVPRNQLRKGLGGTKSDHVACRIEDFVCLCKITLKSAGHGTNSTIILPAGLRKLDESIC